MKEEVLRMDRITFREQGTTELNHFCLDIDAGEIVGLIPINDTGLGALIRLLRQNLPLHYGYVYYRGRLVNHWQESDLTYNRIGVIESRSGLADDLTVADNVFVLRQGFKKRIIRRKVLNRQLEPFLRETGVKLSAEMYARDLTAFPRFITELVKAVVAGCRLIVLMEPASVISDARLATLQRILRHYAGEGISFLYVSRHYEEARQICTRAAIMLNGEIAKVVPTADTLPETLQCFGVEAYTQMVRRQERAKPLPPATAPALMLRDLRFEHIRSLNLSVAPGECVVLQDLNNHILRDLIALLSGARKPDGGQLLVRGKALAARHLRDVAVIQQQPAASMLFPDLSYMDNLCFTLDHRTPGVWRRSAPKASVRAELAPLLGEDVIDKPVEQLSQREKYDLVYTRVLLQRPGVAVCVQPFMGADVEQRMQIWKLMERLLEKGIAVLILAVNLADSLALADRLIRVLGGAVQAVYSREDFGSLPPGTPWHDFWVNPERCFHADAIPNTGSVAPIAPNQPQNQP
ncbi:MAG: sugar ABC transporter ATP-binding protein [Candidatus Limiplasma sp.]|nr:sugar ABC transporter ATP-binding protein [Candidatus Limiplasma sp.]MEA5144460.1 sugar ABC transporter ATP-binding protein [Candidatus Limiplasma sp.]